MNRGKNSFYFWQRKKSPFFIEFPFINICCCEINYFLLIFKQKKKNKSPLSWKNHSQEKPFLRFYFNSNRKTFWKKFLKNAKKIFSRIFLHSLADFLFLGDGSLSLLFIILLYIFLLSLSWCLVDFFDYKSLINSV